MDTEYPVTLSVTLRPVKQPWVDISVANHRQKLQLFRPQTFEFEFVAKEQVELCIEQFDKHDLDPDTAVEITDIRFFGIADPKFVWAGVYWPNYPPHLAGSAPQLPAQSYLSWNGQWRLKFDIPVFVWIHRTLDWGWLYS